MKINNIRIDLISPNPNQPRAIFDDESINNLANSIKQYGIIQPLSVRKLKKGYELIAGERRLLAAKKLKLKDVPCVIISADDRDSGIISIIENIQRENLSFHEIALSYKKLIENYNLTQSELASRLSVSQSSIANKIRLLNLGSEMLEFAVKNNLTERHARALLKLPSSEVREKVLKQIIDKRLNVRETEKLIKRVSSKTPSNKSDVKLLSSLKDIRIFTNSLKQVVDFGIDAGLDVQFDIKQLTDKYEFTIVVNKK